MYHVRGRGVRGRGGSCFPVCFASGRAGDAVCSRPRCRQGCGASLAACSVGQQLLQEAAGGPGPCEPAPHLPFPSLSSLSRPGPQQRFEGCPRFGFGGDAVTPLARPRRLFKGNLSHFILARSAATGPRASRVSSSAPAARPAGEGPAPGRRGSRGGVVQLRWLGPCRERGRLQSRPAGGT